MNRPQLGMLSSVLIRKRFAKGNHIVVHHFSHRVWNRGQEATASRYVNAISSSIEGVSLADANSSQSLTWMSGCAASKYSAQVVPVPTIE